MRECALGNVALAFFLCLLISLLKKNPNKPTQLVRQGSNNTSNNMRLEILVINH